MKKFDNERELLDDFVGQHNWQVFNRQTRRPAQYVTELGLPPRKPSKRGRRALAPDDPRHGTANGYNNHDCRCPMCTEAWRLYMEDLRRRRGIRPIEEIRADYNNVHNANRYSKGKCRCDVCRKLASLRRRAARRKQGMKPNPLIQKYPEGDLTPPGANAPRSTPPAAP